MKKLAIVSSPGKFHLIGEHSSVFGKPAILCAIDKRMKVTLRISKEDNFINYDKSVQKAVCAIGLFIQKKYRVESIKVSLEINSELPVGVGLGSSAALAASIAGAFFHLYNLGFELSELFDAAYQGERVFHGNPSGGDLAVCVYGGVVWFRKETESIKLFRKLDVPQSMFKQVILIDSGKPAESTKKMVEMVGNKNLLDDVLIYKFNESQEILTKNLSDALQKKETEKVFGIIKKAERNLEEIGVVGEKAVKMIKKLEKNGDSVKISGGGGIKDGSGMMVAFCSDKKRTIQFCRENKWEDLNVKLSEEGVRIEK